MLKLSRGKFGTIPHLAYVVSQLHSYHEMFTIKLVGMKTLFLFVAFDLIYCYFLVDSLIELLRLCLEDKKNVDPQSQIMNVRFLGELYLCNLVDSRLMFDTLYTILMLGVENPNKTTDSFRVRLICTILDCCGKNLATGRFGILILLLFLCFILFFAVVRLRDWRFSASTFRDMCWR